ncbi:hypothetical protein M0804_011088 [Polistes exclamans]|nr:hypothetical protein M0804_011088 [Polistes exclamans]
MSSGTGIVRQSLKLQGGPILNEGVNDRRAFLHHGGFRSKANREFTLVLMFPAISNTILFTLGQLEKEIKIENRKEKIGNIEKRVPRK